MIRRHVIITGGASSVGAAAARRFAALGDRVTIMAANTKEIEALADEIGARPVRIDVGDPASVEAAFMAAGPADVLVNSADMVKIGELVTTNVRTWEEILKVNLTGAYLCSLKVLPYMIRKEKGRIINVVGTAGLKGYKLMVAYSAALHGLVGFTRALAEEVSANGITVNAVCPSLLDTEANTAQIEIMAEKLESTPEEVRASFEGRNPLGRLLQPDEVAGAIVFLASAEAGAINGQALPICGAELRG
jgi:NAD(P)-dependent dehydrogenase (short-subunit alcohol dehydrogenase family)